jgi:hypothetical protein
LIYTPAHHSFEVFFTVCDRRLQSFRGKRRRKHFYFAIMHVTALKWSHDIQSPTETPIFVVNSTTTDHAETAYSSTLERIKRQDEMNIFKDIFEELNQGGVKYMVAGGIAVNLYGIERATADLDIVVLLESENLVRFISIAQKLGLKPKIPVKLEDLFDHNKRTVWISNKGMRAFSLFDPKNPFFLIDILIQFNFDFDDIYSRKETVHFENTAIPLVPLGTLIEMKKGTGRPQDEADVFYLTQIREMMNSGA